jgi:hypothetical protein
MNALRQAFSYYTVDFIFFNVFEVSKRVFQADFLPMMYFLVRHLPEQK